MSGGDFGYPEDSIELISWPADELAMGLMRIEKVVEPYMQYLALCRAWHTLEIPRWIGKVVECRSPTYRC